MANVSSASLETLRQAIISIEGQLAAIKTVLAEQGVSLEEGIVGVYEGEMMAAADGKRYPVPPNYASKTMLVSGDTIRMVEDPQGGPARFKQIGKIERAKANGLLARKDGKYEVLTDQGSFKLLQAAVKHYDGQPGDTVFVQFAKQHTKGSWAAIERLVKVGEPMPDLNPLPAGRQVLHAAAPATEPVVEPLPVASTITTDSIPTPVQPTPAQPSAPAIAKPTSQAARPAQSSPASKTNRPRDDRKPSASVSSGPARKKPTTSAGNGPRPHVARPVPMQPAPKRPIEQPALPVDQGEIKVPTEFDDDDLL